MSAATDTSQWKILQSRVKSEKVPHALLLTGSRGVGKMRFAREFANSLLCKSPRVDTGVACGECSACKLVAAGSHPDYVEVAPEQDSRVIKTQQVRALCEQLGLTAQFGGYRVALISPANVLHGGAANCLLKTLEEPRPRVVIILVSSKIGAIPATIRSRCQRVRINRAGETHASVPGKVLSNEHEREWRAGLERRRDYISISSEWSKADHEAIFRDIFAWLTARIKQSFTHDSGELPNADNGNNIFSSEAAKMERQQLFAFYDKLLSAYQFAAKPGINRGALYEQLFVQAQGIKF